MGAVEGAERASRWVAEVELGLDGLGAGFLVAVEVEGVEVRGFVVRASVELLDDPLLDTVKS